MKAKMKEMYVLSPQLSLLLQVKFEMQYWNICDSFIWSKPRVQTQHSHRSDTVRPLIGFTSHNHALGSSAPEWTCFDQSSHCSPCQDVMLPGVPLPLSTTVNIMTLKCMSLYYRVWCLIHFYGKYASYALIKL